jgi:hypothetical protein
MTIRRSQEVRLYQIRLHRHRTGRAVEVLLDTLLYGRSLEAARDVQGRRKGYRRTLLPTVEGIAFRESPVAAYWTQWFLSLQAYVGKSKRRKSFSNGLWKAFQPTSKPAQ